jgi:predicted metal-dependent phosphoesterase TrpH
MCTIPGLRHLARESYTDPVALYHSLKRKGMDLVTVTDHDSIDAAEELRSFPDFFPSEEVTVSMPSGTELHVGVYDLTERQHIEIQRRRTDLPALLAYLSEKRLLFSVNHVFSSLTGARDLSDFAWLAAYFPAFEARNGHMLRRANAAAEQLAAELGRTPLAGSDSHALASAGCAWTEVPGARTKEEFIAGMAAGHTRIHGESGRYWKLTRDVFSICGEIVARHGWPALLAPLVLLVVPAWTAAHYGNEFLFLRQWTATLEHACGYSPALPAPNWRGRMAVQEAA